MHCRKGSPFRLGLLVLGGLCDNLSDSGGERGGFPSNWGDGGRWDLGLILGRFGRFGEILCNIGQVVTFALLLLFRGDLIVVVLLRVRVDSGVTGGRTRVLVLLGRFRGRDDVDRLGIRSSGGSRGLGQR